MFRDIDAATRKIVIALGAILLGNSLATHVSSVVAISGFLNAAGANQILVIWVIDALLIITAASVQTLIVDRFERPTLILSLSFGFMLAFVALRVMVSTGAPDWLNYALLYLLADLQWLFFPQILWIMANDALDISETRQFFPIISAGGALGQILGLTAAAVSPGLLRSLGFSPAELLTMNAGVYAVIFILTYRQIRGVKVREIVTSEETVLKTLTEGFDFIREVLSFRYLMLATVALIVCESVIEFNFFTITESAFSDLGAYQTFYSVYRLGVTLITILMQLFVTSRIIERSGLKNAFFITPVALFLGSLWILGLPGLVSGVGAMVLYKFMQGSIDESTRKSFEALIPEERRGRVSTFMESYVLSIGTIISVILLGLILLLGSASSAPSPVVYAGLGVATATLSLLAILRMRANYDSSMLNWRLKRRQRGSSILDKLEL